ncbi:multicopper oxidase family protein [Streptomyces sp. NPDC006879]|uniref:multicopper oxidase family protein n=1 Tax=Streptomyces sp. NPDC006879 TaxID=3364767 RepID=UPI00369A4501
MRSLFGDITHTRRNVLGLAAAATGSALLGACSTTDPNPGPQVPGHGGAPFTPRGYLTPDGPKVRAAEAARRGGRERAVRLTATAATIDLGAGRTVRTWAYGDQLPGPEIRVTAGETLAVTLANHLPEDTSAHWHGLALRNDMDGVPGITQRGIRPGGSFAYRFTAPHPGTYWFHPHSGTQRDRGLYAPLIVEDPREPLSYDKEWVLVLDDWLDGVAGSTPDAVLAELRQGMLEHGGAHSGHGSAGSGSSHMLMGAESELLGGDAGDVAYPYYLVNGRSADAPEEFRARPGDRIRLRIVNVGGDTAFRVALGGHSLTVTHTDGFPVEHRESDALLIGMGERYDVLVTARDGVFPLTAVAEGKGAAGLAVLRTGEGRAPAADVRPRELAGRVAGADALKAAPGAALGRRTPDRVIRIRLTGSMARYDWAFDGRPYSPGHRYGVRAGERVRLVFSNTTAMWHPLHLHGHTFALAGTSGGARKDTALVLPKGTLAVDFDADNPGQWMIHCHNVYHAEAGMMAVLGYLE